MITNRLVPDFSGKNRLVVDVFPGRVEAWIGRRCNALRVEVVTQRINELTRVGRTPVFQGLRHEFLVGDTGGGTITPVTNYREFET